MESPPLWCDRNRPQTAMDMLNEATNPFIASVFAASDDDDEKTDFTADTAPSAASAPAAASGSKVLAPKSPSRKKSTTSAFHTTILPFLTHEAKYVLGELEAMTKKRQLTQHPTRMSSRWSDPVKAATNATLLMKMSVGEDGKKGRADWAVDLPQLIKHMAGLDYKKLTPWNHVECLKLAVAKRIERAATMLRARHHVTAD